MAMSIKPKLRPLGHITQDMELLISEMIDGHDLQHGEVLNLIRGYLEIHYPGAKEEYEVGGHPEFYYGPIRK